MNKTANWKAITRRATIQDDIRTLVEAGLTPWKALAQSEELTAMLERQKAQYAELLN